MALTNSDLLIVQRAQESYKIQASEIKSFILGGESSGGGTPEFVGNAATATKLQTARLINGTPFDGTADIVTDYWGDTITINNKNVNGSANVTVDPYVENTNDNSTYYLSFVPSNSNSYQKLYVDSGLNYNPSNNTLTTTTFKGDLQGTAEFAVNAGNSSGSTNADNVYLETDNGSNANRYVSFSDGPTGYQRLNSDNDFLYNPAQNTITCGTFNGAHSGNGSALTSLNASQLSTGTVPVGRLSGSYNINITGNAGNSEELNGLDASHYLRSDVQDEKTNGTLLFYDNVRLTMGNDNDAQYYYNGSNLYLDLQPAVANYVIRDGSSSRFTFNRSSGNFTAVGDVTAFSDITLKEDIRPIEKALDRVQQILGVTYNRIDLDGKRQAGVIAQDVEKVLPEVVHTDENGIKSVAYGNMIGLLIEAIKEQQRQIDELKRG